MAKRLFGTRIGLRARLLLAVAGFSMSAGLALQAQDSVPFAPEPAFAVPSGEGQPREPKERPLSGRLPDKPSLPPTLSIPVEPLGFSAPPSIYLGERFSMASLDFLDENRLLFTFRVPGLMHREAGNGAESDEHQIRAVVLVLPAGAVQAEALWTFHDRARYLWMLKDGHFLLRDRDGLQQGDATLALKPFLHFPGPLLWLEMDPMQQFLVTNSREPAAPKAGEAASQTNHPGDQDPSPGTPVNHPGDQDPSPGTPVTAEASIVVDGQKPPKESDPPQTDLVVRILRRDSGQVMLVSRTRAAIHLPINEDGYLEGLRGNGQLWLLNLNFFTGGSKVLGRVDSMCSPVFDFVSQREVLVTTCAAGGARNLVAVDTGGRRLWGDSTQATEAWPLVVRSPDGSRLAWETLAVSHAINSYSPLYREDVKGQLVRVFDAADGHVALESQASPALDAGGNVAISPSGRRVAVINAGAIQIFELPAPAALVDGVGNQAGR